MKDIKQFCPVDKMDWREWLKSNHQTEDAIWLVLYKKNAPTSNLSWSEAVDMALCYGWIDSVKKTIDDHKYQQYFCKRKPKSIWSKVNKDKIDYLIKEHQMTEAGLKSIEIAKSNGSWSQLDSIDALIIPQDLKEALSQNSHAEEYFSSLSKSNKKILLYWIMSAKRTDTRKKRIREIAQNAAIGQKPKSFR